MAWNITTTSGEETTIKQLRKQYPRLVGYRNGFRVSLRNLSEFRWAGFSSKDDAVLFWATEAQSRNSDGGNAVAYATWNP